MRQAPLVENHRPRERALTRATPPVPHVPPPCAPLAVGFCPSWRCIAKLRASWRRVARRAAANMCCGQRMVACGPHGRMQLDASAETLQLIGDVCKAAVNLDFAQSYASVHGPKAAIGKLYGKRVKSLASGDGVVVDRPIKLTMPRERRRRSSGRSGRSKRARTWRSNARRHSPWPSHHHRARPRSPTHRVESRACTAGRVAARPPNAWRTRRGERRSVPSESGASSSRRWQRRRRRRRERWMVGTARTTGPLARRRWR